LIVLKDLLFEFGARTLFSDLNWHIRPDEKIGLIGANGTGKSTLLRIISGEYTPSGGTISTRNELRLGFLNQDLLSYLTDKSILEVAKEAFKRELELHDQIEEMLVKLETDHSDEVLNRLHVLQSEFDALDGYQVDVKSSEILEGLGFSTTDLQRPLKEFSGGWRMRVMLAKILLQKPNVLLLDEPTNHLDLPSIEWLEGYLHSYEGTVIIVSHDRFFLDKIVNRIAELSNSQLTLYTGNYSDYLEQKEERNELLQNQARNQEKYIKEQERFIERFRAKASKASAVQSRVKALEKLERVEDPDAPAASIRVRFSVDKNPGKIINHLEIKKKQYGQHVIFDNCTVEVVRGDKIAMVGANGKGKSTLLRMLAGTEEFDGKAEPGYNVISSFYAQHQLESLNLANNPLEELQQTAPEESDTYLRSLLGAFLLKGDDVFKKIKVLSGGEKARVALAKTILDKANFLLLDEPTNHLDIQSVNVLVDVLNRYEGTYIVVSHDRYFLSRIANKIWYIENHILKEYPGTYAEYDEWLLSKSRNAAEQKKESKKDSGVKKANKKEEPAVVIPDKNAAVNKDQKKEKQKLEQQVKKWEGELEIAKKKHEELSSLMSDPEIFKDALRFKKLQQDYAASERNLNHIQNEWESHYLRLIEFGH
jgi:ATP-binding cassette subfamily F protein 3